MENKKDNLRETIMIEISAWFLVVGIVYTLYISTF